MPVANRKSQIANQKTRWTLQAKLVLGLIGILTAIMGLSLLLLTTRARNRLEKDYRNLASVVSDVAEAGLENGMISRNPAEIGGVLQAINHRESIEGVVILDKRGEIRHAADAREVGRVLPIGDPTCRLCHDRTPTERPETVILPAAGTKRILRVAKPILNQPRCQACHQERVLGMLVTDFSLAEVDRQAATTLGELLFWALATMAGVIGVAVGFVHLLVTRRLDHFLRVIRAIGAGDLDRRTGLAGGDEIGELAASFDQMVQRMAIKTRELEALNTVAAAVSSSLELDVVLNAALNEVLKVPGVDAVAIHVVEQGRLPLRAYRGIPTELVALVDGEPVEGSLPALVLRSGEPVTMSLDPKELPSEIARQADLQAAVASGFQTFACFPLKAEGEVVGVMPVASRQRHDFTPEDVALLKAIGNEVGMAIQNARLHEETKRLAITDGLTGLYNHRHFYQVLEAELARVARYDTQLSLLMVDIDHFKQYNDAYGHLAGDRLLQDLARLLTGLTREVDTVARYGGEEFVVVLPHTSKAGALALAERLRVSVESQLLPGSPSGTRISISAGVATHPLDAVTAEELIHAADTALYQAKRSGKNKVCAYGF
ncbi:MAG: diguanylate cyclase [Chloroflexota bacterium]